MKNPNHKEKPVVFLDRDGTLNVEAGYIRNAEDLILIKGAAQSVKRLNDAGVAAILVTNQSGVARKYYPESHIGVLHDRLQSLLSKEDAFLDAIYYCPHLPVNGSSDATACICRKPATGMIDLAFEKNPDLNRKLSFMVGDKVSDIELAQNCRARSILVKTGYGESSLKELQGNTKVQPDFIAEDICQAVDWILSELGQ